MMVMVNPSEGDTIAIECHRYYVGPGGALMFYANAGDDIPSHVIREYQSASVVHDQQTREG